MARCLSQHSYLCVTTLFYVTWINPHDIPIFGDRNPSILFLSSPIPARHPARQLGSAKGKTWAATNGPRCLGAIACATSQRSWVLRALAGPGRRWLGVLVPRDAGLGRSTGFFVETRNQWNNMKQPKVSKGHFNIKTCKKLNKHVGIYVQVIGMYHMSVEPRSRE